jgi:hypothetical protein
MIPPPTEGVALQHRVSELRAVCASCPVRGHCLADAVAEPIRERFVGPLRVGLTGAKPWRSLHKRYGDSWPTSEVGWQQLADDVLSIAPAATDGALRAS